VILETIKVKREGGKGFRIINASDFRPSLHQRYEEQAGQASQPVADAQIVPPISQKKGKRK